MNERDAKSVLLVRAIEQNDPGAAVLSQADRLWATREAGPPPADAADPDADERPLSQDEERFLARRAELLRQRLEKQHPGVTALHCNVHWRGWISLAVCAGAGVLGLAANQLGPENRINIIAFPLLGMLLWNAAVYAALLLGWLGIPFGNTSRGGGWLARGLARLAELPRALPAETASAADDRALVRGLRQAAADWLHYGLPLHVAHARRVLHLAAALFALGAVAGLYLRGLGFEYRAGWESTFLDAEAVHVLLQVLQPASWLTGIPIAGIERLAELRWPGGRGENAAPWIHLYAVTAALFIVVPRAVLAGWAGLAERRLRRQFPLPGADDAYFRRLRMMSGGRFEVAQVVAYALRPPARSKDALAVWLGEWLGPQLRVEFGEPIEYGDEDEYLATLAWNGAPAADYLVVLFNMASTPEPESQGRLLQGLKAQLSATDRLRVVVDESAYRRRLGGQGGYEARLAERRRNWQRLAQAGGVEAVFLDLSAPRIESAPHSADHTEDTR